jgi:bleomycin hydrolase
MSISAERLAKIQELATPSSDFLARSIAKNGIAPIKDDPNILKEYLSTKYTIDTGNGTNQASSGRCWIYSALNWMRTLRLKDYGKQFEYSQNYVAFWDKFERANHFLETMCSLKDQDVSSQELQNVLVRIYTDGGEWELFENVVMKYGIVPRYSMPESGFSGQSAGYMDILKKRLKEGGGLLHKLLREGGANPSKETLERVEAIKEQLLVEVYRVLVCYLGTPPKDFLWQAPKGDKKKDEKKPAEEDAKKQTESTAGVACSAGVESEKCTAAPAAEKEEGKKEEAPKGLVVEEYRPFVRLTPLQFLEQSLFTFGEKVHLSHLPYHPEGRLLVADVVSNMHEGKRLQAFNTNMSVLKAAVRASIQAGQPVEIACEMRTTDRPKGLLAHENDLTDQIFGFDRSIALSKGDELLYQVTSVAHGMVLIGCDDPEPNAVAGAKESVTLPLGPLWKVENSWKDHQFLFMTDTWFDRNCYDIVVDRRFVPQDVLDALDQAVKAADHILLPTADPFCKI